MKFVKMHGLGNDFVFFTSDQLNGISAVNLAKKICRRGFSVGADGIVIVSDSNDADYEMKIINADGSEAEMCGNAIRCLGKYLYEVEKDKRDKFDIETKAGIKKLELVTDNDLVKSVTVDMGIPGLRGTDIPIRIDKAKIVNEKLQVIGTELEFTAVSMGNPHAIVFCEEIDNNKVKTLGPEIERHPLFQNGTNVEFVKINDRNNINVSVWERGVGETLACGTGACASAVASVLNGYTANKVTVNLPGGSLLINWENFSGRVFMTGDCNISFTGEINYTQGGISNADSEKN